MIRLVHTITIAILLIFAGSLSAQSIIKKAQVTPSASSPRSPIATSDIEELNNAKEQIKILDAQLQATKSYQSSFLDTVHWALSVVLALVVFLIGYGWITNFKMHERDKELLKGELEVYVRSKAIELDDMFKTKLEDANTKSEERLKGALVIVNGRAIDLNNRVFK
ncbi:MAG: hypothetical protein Q8R54_05475, partial [Methylobacter sp.]|nr:hypothetical protein [Methylobacter sp.]